LDKPAFEFTMVFGFGRQPCYINDWSHCQLRRPS